MSGSVGASESKFTSAHVAVKEWEQKLRIIWDMPLSRDDSNRIDDEICEDLFIKGHYQTMSGGKIISISYRKVVQYYLSQEKV